MICRDRETHRQAWGISRGFLVSFLATNRQGAPGVKVPFGFIGQGQCIK